MSDEPKLDGMVPRHLLPKAARIAIEQLEVMADIGFHDFEVGAPQRLLVWVDVWLEDLAPPSDDQPELAWDYDFVREQVVELAAARRYNLQETLAHAIYLRLAALRGVQALKVRVSKPDVYPDTTGVGVEYASFSTAL
ncbi:MAG: dihydroneopterin aldolase [Pseudomonadota bacterium]|nr:dihydroneopterin aldolase [Sphingomonas sp.]MDQ3478120.1 dihydroneopterin aldolase [Pseudomonadota bacterium]